MIEGGGKVRRVAAIADIDTNDIEAGGQCGLRQGQHVGGFARRGQSVNRQDRPARLLVLAVAPCQDAHAKFSIKKPVRGGVTPGVERRGPITADDRLQMAVLEQRAESRERGIQGGRPPVYFHCFAS
jgi:hypothetical protein